MSSDSSHHEGENSTTDQPEQAKRPPTHLPETIRLGALAGLEDEELRLEAHLVMCPICREPALELTARAERDADACVEANDCARARNSLFRFLEQGREAPSEAIAHLRDCDPCHDLFLESARCACTWELDEDAIAAQD